MMLLRSHLLKKTAIAMMGMVFFVACEKKDASKLPLIAITQIIEHKSLDEERAGLIQGLKEGGYVVGENIRLEFDNAQGNIATATQIANKFQSMNPSVVVAFSTPSAQAMVGAFKQIHIPIVFSAVTSPLNANLVTSMEAGRGESVTGISDELAPKAQLGMIKKLMPHLKKLGVIYNPGEPNSVKSVKDMKKEAKIQSIDIVESTASKTSDVVPAAHNLVGKVEAIYVPNDNTAVSAMKSIVQVGEKYKLPIFAGDMGSFDEGGVFAVAAYDRFMLGKKVADYVIQILKGVHPGQLAVLEHHPLSMRVNLKAAKAMGLPLDKSQLQGFQITQ